MAKESRSPVFWEGVKAEFEAGIMSVADISRKFGVSRAAITKKSTYEGWKRKVTSKTPRRGKIEVMDAKDLAILENEWKAGVKPPKSIADDFGIKTKTLEYYADKHGWVRGSLGTKIAKAAEEKLARLALAHDEPVVGMAAAIVDANAQIQATVRARHRQDITKFMNMANDMADELAAYSSVDGRELLAKLAALLSDEENGGDKAAISRGQLDAFLKALGLQGRIVTAEKLTTMFKNLIALEREAYGIGKESNEGGGSFENALERILRE